MSLEIEKILERIQRAMPEAEIVLCKNLGPSGQHSLLVGNGSLVKVCQFLREKLEFDLLSNVSGVDWLEAAKAQKVAVLPEQTMELEAPATCGFLEVVYHLYSTSLRVGPLVLRARTMNRLANNQIPSLVSVFRSAEFQEREVFDLYGVVFSGHPDLRRILMWDEFVDYPMRKDYQCPDDYEYEPTPHDEVLKRAKGHYPEEGEAK